MSVVADLVAHPNWPVLRTWDRVQVLAFSMFLEAVGQAPTPDAEHKRVIELDVGLYDWARGVTEIPNMTAWTLPG